MSYVQPDLSKTGGVTEAMRIAGMAYAWKLSYNPHTSATGINMAATINTLAAVDLPDISKAMSPNTTRSATRSAAFPTRSTRTDASSRQKTPGSASRSMRNSSTPIH